MEPVGIEVNHGGRCPLQWVVASSSSPPPATNKSPLSRVVPLLFAGGWMPRRKEDGWPGFNERRRSRIFAWPAKMALLVGVAIRSISSGELFFLVPSFLFQFLFP
jgi:hypothetical protein